ncbi:Metallo-dependent phosphatase [Aspergillus candidus]|uniref:Metallo-dependent phosphatase n=1 Tax=Aspergillus candidus TaxID=41067 RepID=A0A2I2FGN5_ASPCN|nr:Metallo-dependent phosphatase [Aspergillus candidus]PLB39793.1 Metallo-dependent phosphatase [Aspergillus candidus]
MSLFGNKNTTPLDAFLNRPRPSAWQQFLSQPCVFLARKVYTWQQVIPAQPLTNPVSVVCISDTHNSQPALPDGDILIHAGDLTQSGSPKELQAAVDWLHAQPHTIKVVIAGNHDLCLDANFPHVAGHASSTCTSRPWGELINWRDVTYLQDAETTVTCDNGRHLHIYGSPNSPRHGNWAFQYPRSQDIWSGKVPDDIDILVTHGPPRAHLDLLNLGCVHLLQELWRVRPRLHVFGHVHEGAGTEWLQFDALQDVYERTVVSKGGIWNLVQVIKAFVEKCFSPSTEARCLLVNPAIVGGLRDDERRRPVKVII